MDCKTSLAYVHGSVDQALLRRNENLAAENRILHQQLKGRIRLRDGERKKPAESASA
jgi:putative transposase